LLSRRRMMEYGPRAGFRIIPGASTRGEPTGRGSSF
jgi:hypothetical protein